MLRSLIGLYLAGFASGAHACDTCTSTSKEPGVRILTDDFTKGTFTITEGGRTTVYEKSAGTFRGYPITHDAYEIGFDKYGRYVFGGERFAEYCK